MLKNKKLIALVEDEWLFVEDLKVGFDPVNIDLDFYETTNSLLDSLQEKKIRYDIIIVDRFIKNYDTLKSNFVFSCRELGVMCPVLLWSSSFPNIGEMKDFSGFIPKDMNIFNFIENYVNPHYLMH